MHRDWRIHGCTQCRNDQWRHDRPALDGWPATSTVDYNLYTDSGYSTLWGDGTTGATVAGTSTGGNTADSPITVYGQTAAGQNVPIGDYSDVVLVSVAF